MFLPCVILSYGFLNVRIVLKVYFFWTVGVVFDIHSCCVQLVSSKDHTVLCLISFRVGLTVHGCLPASFCEEQNPAVPFEPDTRPREESAFDHNGPVLAPNGPTNDKLKCCEL